MMPVIFEATTVRSGLWSGVYWSQGVCITAGEAKRFVAPGSVLPSHSRSGFRKQCIAVPAVVP